jgi:hypothetical protein
MKLLIMQQVLQIQEESFKSCKDKLNEFKGNKCDLEYLFIVIKTRISIVLVNLRAINIEISIC